MADDGLWSRIFERKAKETTEESMPMTARVVGRKAKATEVFGGLSDVLSGTHDLGKNATSTSSYDNFDQTFDLYDSMVELDPELNGAVRAVSLTANNYTIDYTKGKNAQTRIAIQELVEETLDFDDLLINAMRNLMVYGNDINKLVGKAGVGITKVQSLPIKQVTILDQRADTETLDTGLIGQVTQDNPIMDADYYMFRESKVGTMKFPAKNVWHMKIDYRSNWFRDRLGRHTYGIWGASRFTSLKQAIRAKYNSLNNRIALEDSLTKQFISIDASAVEHIQDPAEAKERLEQIMDSVAKLLETLEGDQIPILPDYVKINHVDLSNAIPDPGTILETVNADIAAVLHVPRVAAGQERGSTFAATYNANVWAVQAIARLHAVITQSVRELFSRHLTLLGIPHTKAQVPVLEFGTVDEESPLNRMRRAEIGYDGGMITLNQSLEIIGLPDADGKEGEKRKELPDPTKLGTLPREKETENNSKPEGE